MTERETLISQLYELVESSTEAECAEILAALEELGY